MEQFNCKTRILTGDAAKLLEQLGCRKLLLVTDPFFLKNGTAERITAGISQREIFHEVTPDPSVELAAKGTAAVKAFQPDTIAALGGGSTMDCAKAMTYFYGQPVQLVAIPTTSGSGSEVTDFAVLTHGDTKHPLIDARICPQVAILDEKLLQALPKSLIADTGFDVLSHALEAFVATGAGAITDALAKDAFCVAYAHLPASYGGDAAVRGRIHMAATMAGMAFSQAGLGLCHAIAHSLGGIFHVPHGRLNAILLPAVIECNTPAAAEKYARLARSAGFAGSADGVAVRNLKNGLIRLRRQLQLPETLQQAGIDGKLLRFHMGAILNAVLADPCCKTNPLPPEEFLVRRILEQAAGHG